MLKLKYSGLSLFGDPLTRLSGPGAGQQGQWVAKTHRMMQGMNQNHLI